MHVTNPGPDSTSIGTSLTLSRHTNTDPLWPPRIGTVCRKSGRSGAGRPMTRDTVSDTVRHSQPLSPRVSRLVAQPGPGGTSSYRVAPKRVPNSCQPTTERLPGEGDYRQAARAIERRRKDQERLSDGFGAGLDQILQDFRGFS